MNTITATHCVVGRDGRGSAGEVHFVSESALQAAKAKMRNTRQSVMPGKTIWLDMKKTREELAPARAIHRACEILTDLEGRREDTAMLDKNVGSKGIFCNGQRAWYRIKSVLKSTIAAQWRYTAAEIASVSDYAAD